MTAQQDHGVAEVPGATTGPPLIAVHGVSKSFGVVRALQSVSMEARVGEVVGLIGENGAGKSTLLGVMSGTVTPDEGEVHLAGEHVTLHSYADATRRGVFRIYQHQALVPNVSVGENVFLGQEKRFARAGWLNRGAMARRARLTFEELGVHGIDPSAPLSRYSFAERQVIEIVRSIAQADLLGIEHPVVLLDEPTSALSREQVDFFFEFVRRFRHRAAQVFVSHRLEELLELSDRVYVLKDGVTVAQLDDVAGVSESALHGLMVGRLPDDVLYDEHHQRGSAGREVLTIRNLTLAGAFEDVSLSLHEGEVLGLAGVVGSGKSELGRRLFEAGRGVDSGEIVLDGRRLSAGGPREGIRNGLGYVPPERHAEGIIGQLSVTHNHSLPRVGSLGRNPLVDPVKERRSAESSISTLRVKTPSASTSIGDLSGGNQQKVVFARWIAVGSRFLVLDNPTNGVDVGAKTEIYRLIRRLTADGVSVLLISDDLQELIGLSDRVAVMRDGHVTNLIETPPQAKPSEADLVAHMV
jgi:ribose transport system ATP-binding protein